MKKIFSAVLVLGMVMLALAACGGGNDDNGNNNGGNNVENHQTQNDTSNDTSNVDIDRTLDGTWTHGAESVTFYGNAFEISGGAGHRHLPNGTGTFVRQGSNMIFNYDDGSVETITNFSFDGEMVRFGGHGYRRQ